MPIYLNPTSAPEPSSRYSQGVLLRPTSRRLLISGQIGLRPDKVLAEGLEAQTEQAFDNLLAVVAAAEMIPTDLVKIVTYCTLPGSIAIVRQVRERKLGRHTPASTYIQVAGLASPEFLIEIEGEAVREAV